VIRLFLGYSPRKVAVRLGIPGRRMVISPTGKPAVSCIWDARLKQRPRRLKLSTRASDLIRSRNSAHHGRRLHP
jgi:hypothetical protein